MSWFANNILAGRRTIYKPKITIAQRVIDTIVRGVGIYETETGEALIGLALQGTGGNSAPDSDLVVLDTIAPDASAVRTSVYFEQGDDLQSDTLNWLADNWNDRRKQADSKPDPQWDLPLIHLGDWHKHPGMLVEPSIGDAHTAVDLIFDRDIQRPYILAILATIWEREKAQQAVSALVNDPVPNGVPILVDLPDDPASSVRIDCWYLSRQTRVFVRLSPTVQPNDMLPALPIVGWHLRNSFRLRREYDAFRKAGYTVQIDERDTDGVPPREVCFTLVGTDPRTIWVVVTPADFPASPPIIRRVPPDKAAMLAGDQISYDTVWPHSVPVPLADLPAWQSDLLLSELLKG